MNLHRSAPSLIAIFLVISEQSSLFSQCYVARPWKWSSNNVTYHINSHLATPYATQTEYENAIRSAAAQWNNAGSNFRFNEGAQVSYDAGQEPAGVFQVGWLIDASVDAPGITRISHTSNEIVKVETYFNQYYSISATFNSNYYDIFVILHEFGHWLELANETDPACSTNVMYKYIYPGDFSHRSLTADDKAGIISLYGGPMGVEDYIVIYDGPTVITQNSSSNYYSANFIDEYPYGDYIVGSWSWSFLVEHGEGEYLAANGTTASGFWQLNLGTLPYGYYWYRDGSGNVKSRLKVVASDNEGYIHVAYYNVGIGGVPYNTTSGTLTHDETWGDQNTLTGNVIVPSNITLTILENATVTNISNITVQTGGNLIIRRWAWLGFNSAANVYDESPPKGSLTIFGKIHADRATFTSNNSDPNYYWGAIYISNSYPGGDGNWVKNCTISKCKFGLTIYNSRFESSSDEIYNNTFTHCLNPIRLTGGSFVNRITYNHLTDNLEDGIAIYQSTAQHVDHNQIQKSAATYSGRDGFWIFGSWTQPLLTHNEVAYGSGNGIRCEYYAAPNLGGPDGGSAVHGYNGIHHNGNHGVYAQASTQPFLGNNDQSGCNAYGGYNSIYSNSNKQLYVATSSQSVNARWNWWGVAPDDGNNGFTSSTMTTLFGNSYPFVAPALYGGGGGYPAAPFAKSKDLRKQVIMMIPQESILLALGDQLVIAKMYNRALQIYDSLITTYPESEEAEAAVVRVHYATLSLNQAVKDKRLVGEPKDAADYFTKLTTRVASTRLERSAVELATINAAMQAQVGNAIRGFETIADRWPGEESEKHALASLVELYLASGNTKSAEARLSALNLKFPQDPVTSLVNDLVYMIRNSGAPNQASVSGSERVTNKSAAKEDQEQATDAKTRSETTLHPSYPNPFNPTTSVTYSLSRPGMVDLVAFDVLGRQVVELIRGYQTEGTRTIQLDGSKLPSGTYFIRLNAEGRIFIQRVLLVK